MPLTYRPGDLAEVDFFEVLVDIDGIRRKAWLFLMRLMYSGCDFAWTYERQDQISFLDGHVHAFAYFDGVPARVAYDYAPRHIVVDDDADGAAQARKRPLAEVGPDLRARLPHQEPHGFARVGQRQDEEPRATMLAGLRTES